MNDTVKYLGSLFGIEKKIQFTSGSGVYLRLRPIQGMVYSKRILRIATSCPISAACVELVDERVENKELENAK